ncbi:MAG: hypothetical protein M1828_007217 [Chrysothrix sp. TS-e1954]|nr:MAG: hypothetical protein M1828_007217 [Chrysothrix sp. TS-e1954]
MVAGLPFRFKAGGSGHNTPAAMDQHHHKSTTKVIHKAFKPRFASKSSLKNQAKGRVEHLEKGSRGGKHQQVLNKMQRRNQAKQKRLVHSHEQAKVKSVFTGKHGAPRIVAVIPLCEDVDTTAAVKTLNGSLDMEQGWQSLAGLQVHVDRFKQNLCYLPMNRDVFLSMNACRAADFVLFLLSPMSDVDELGELMLRSIEGQGISTVYSIVQGLEKTDSAKQKANILASVKSYMLHFFPDQQKIFSVDSPQECQNLIRSLCTTMPKGVNWRESRSWLLAEEIEWQKGKGDKVASLNTTDVCDVILTGVVRGKGLKADRLVHVNDWGDFQVDSITEAPRHIKNKSTDQSMIVDTSTATSPMEKPSEHQETLDELAPEEVVMDDVATTTITTDRRGVLLDDQHYYLEPNEGEEVLRPKRLPKGTSGYQSAWYLGDVSDSGSDLEDLEQENDLVNDKPDPADGDIGVSNHYAPEHTEGEPSTYAESEMFIDRPANEEAEELAAHRSSRKTEAEEHLQFPDEVELPPNVLARERLARYRGLRSMRTSTWDTDEDKLHEPQEWGRLLDINDYKAAKSKMTSEALVGGVQPGVRVRVHLRNVPTSIRDKQGATEPVTLFSLLRHEHKRTAVNCTLTLKSDYPEAIKSKEELLVQCGARRLLINPLFSQVGNTPNDVHIFERFVNPGQTVVASFTGPLTWGAVPLLFFRRRQTNIRPEDVDAMDVSTSPLPDFELIGHGTLLPASTKRIIAKRIVLTGEPFKINKKLVTVRYMFFNAEDVAWFKALQLWTNRGRQGQIKESLGTHGYFKATFDGRAGLQDAVGVSLYKRVWPRTARPFLLG